MAEQHPNFVGRDFVANPQNRNFSGKPRGARNRSTIYREHMEKAGKKGLLVVDEMVRAAIYKALQGDITALKELMDGAYGKVPDKVVTADVTPNAAIDVTNAVLKQIPTETLQQILAEAEDTQDGVTTDNQA